MSTRTPHITSFSMIASLIGGAAFLIVFSFALRYLFTDRWLQPQQTEMATTYYASPKSQRIASVVTDKNNAGQLPLTTPPESESHRNGPASFTVSSDPLLPDLVVNYMKVELETGGSCNYASTNLGIRVWFSNEGEGDAAPFVVEVNGTEQQVTNGLAAGQNGSLWFSSFSGGMADNYAFVDATDLISESNEDNNWSEPLI